ncbi:MAG: FAD-binding oxidoreductase [bacterium]
MKTSILQSFDGYAEIVQAIETSRAHGLDYTAQKDSPFPYIERLHPARLRLRVADVIEETPSTKTFRLVSTGAALPPFQAGQYLSLIVTVGGVRTTRPYSISSPPNHLGYYDITVRRFADGLVSNHLLDNVRRGDLLETSGPAGELTYNPLFHSKTMVCLAGGSGITPFMSMIREVVECGLDRTVWLFYGNRECTDVIFHDALTEISRRFENVRYVPVIEDPSKGYRGKKGFITGALIRKTLGALGDETFYVCGPQAMYDFCIPELQKLGVPRRRLRKEVYGTPADVRKAPGWPADLPQDARFAVRLNGTKVLEAKAGEPLLACLERGGIAVPTLCRSGECSLCRVKLLSGEVYQLPGALVRKSDRKHGYIHTCASYPLGDIAIQM